MIRNIIFDLGNVLVDVNYEKFREKIFQSNITKEAYDNFFLDGNYRLLGYEAGDLSSDEFVSRCINSLSLKMQPREFIDSFNNMFTEILPMKQLVVKFADENKFNLFLLSNTSPLHFDYVRSNFDFVNRLHKFGLSYELKSLKPEDEIYRKAISLFCAEPEECLFIDDLAENCDAAGKLGIRTIVYNKHDHRKFELELEKELSL